MTFSLKDGTGLPLPVDVPVCGGTYAGNIPVPPAKPYYWLAVTWNYGYTGSTYDLWADFYQAYSGTYFWGGTYGWANPGSLNAPPYVKYFWDSDDPNLGPGDLRCYAEVIRVSKTIAGTAVEFYVEDFIINPDGSITPNTGSTNWGSSGIKAYLYRGTTLLKTYTPPAGAGAFWVIADVAGTTVYDVNEVLDP